MSFQKIVLIVIVAAVFALALAVDVGKKKRENDAAVRRHKAKQQVQQVAQRQSAQKETKKKTEVDNKDMNMSVATENVEKESVPARMSAKKEFDPFAEEPDDEDTTSLDRVMQDDAVPMARAEYVEQLLQRIRDERKKGEEPLIRMDILSLLTKEELEAVLWEERQRDRMKRGRPRESDRDKEKLFRSKR